MRHIRINNTPLVHPSQASHTRSLPNLLSEKPERQYCKSIHAKHRGECPRNDVCVAVLGDPVQETEAHAEGDGLFAEVHYYEHFCYVGVVGVHCVGLYR